MQTVFQEPEAGTGNPCNQEWPRQTKPKKGQFMNFSHRRIPEQKFNVNRACFPKEKHRIHKMGHQTVMGAALLFSL